MTCFLLVVFTASELHDLDLLRTAMSLDGRSDLATFCFELVSDLAWIDFFSKFGILAAPSRMEYCV